MGQAMPGPRWERKAAETPTRCSSCRKTVPAGETIDVRHGEDVALLPPHEASIFREAYPNDPTTFCVPCVTPEPIHPRDTDIKVRCLCGRYVGYNLRKPGRLWTPAPCGCVYVKYVERR